MVKRLGSSVLGHCVESFLASPSAARSSDQVYHASIQHQGSSPPCTTVPHRLPSVSGREVRSSLGIRTSPYRLAGPIVFQQGCISHEMGLHASPRLRMRIVHASYVRVFGPSGGRSYVRVGGPSGGSVCGACGGRGGTCEYAAGCVRARGEWSKSLHIKSGIYTFTQN